MLGFFIFCFIIFSMWADEISLINLRERNRLEEERAKRRESEQATK
jgi:hypothetical protein